MTAIFRNSGNEAAVILANGVGIPIAARTRVTESHDHVYLNQLEIVRQTRHVVGVCPLPEFESMKGISICQSSRSVQANFN